MEAKGKYMNTFRFIRTLSMFFLMGSATGAYGEWRYEHGQAERIQAIALRGYCAQRDPMGTPFWYNCQDAAIAAELTSRAIEHDDEIAKLISATEHQPTNAKRSRAKGDKP